MSKEIGRLYGTNEASHDPLTQTTIYNDAEMWLTSFWGGSNRGSCVQFTIDMGGKHAYIQLDANRVTKLIAVLQEWKKSH